MSEVRRASGLMEELHERFQESGLYREYGNVYEKYVELIESKSEGSEALKRAIFLKWYESAEPACFSGVFGLSEEASLKVFRKLESKVKEGASRLRVGVDAALLQYDCRVGVFSVCRFTACANAPEKCQT